MLASEGAQNKRFSGFPKWPDSAENGKQIRQNYSDFF